jgi:hypothetical protein
VKGRQALAARPADMLDAAAIDVAHARGALALVYHAVESGELVAEGVHESGALCAVIRSAIRAADRAGEAIASASQ